MSYVSLKLSIGAIIVMFVTQLAQPINSALEIGLEPKTIFACGMISALALLFAALAKEAL